MNSPSRIVLLVTILGTFVWSGIDPLDRATWLMEVAPVMVAVPLLLLTARRFPLTNLLYGLIALHAIVLMVGGKYTYAEMPLFNWIRDTFGFARNHYDRVGHFMQGFVPAMVIRELLLRTSPLRAGKWLFTIIVFSCLGVSALYELAEWLAALLLGSGADAFLGTQGDVWDTQWDMFLAGIGAITAQLSLARIHDRALDLIRPQSARNSETVSHTPQTAGKRPAFFRDDPHRPAK
jgi:putative membrane protein